MHEAASGEGLVCTGIASQRAMARGLRTWLRKVGVDRASLFTSTAVNLNVRWHDLRATCGTWLAVEGRSAIEIRDVLGHTQTSMTDRNVRRVSRAGWMGLAGGGNETPRTSTGLVGVSRDLAVQNSEPSEAELERGILEAVRLGLGDVARALEAAGGPKARGLCERCRASGDAGTTPVATESPP